MSGCLSPARVCWPRPVRTPRSPSPTPSWRPPVRVEYVAGVWLTKPLLMPALSTAFAPPRPTGARAGPSRDDAPVLQRGTVRGAGAVVARRRGADEQERAGVPGRARVVLRGARRLRRRVRERRTAGHRHLPPRRREGCAGAAGVGGPGDGLRWPGGGASGCADRWWPTRRSCPRCTRPRRGSTPRSRRTRAGDGLAGTTLFMASDFTLGIRRFVMKEPGAAERRPRDGDVHRGAGTHRGRRGPGGAFAARLTQPIQVRSARSTTSDEQIRPESRRCRGRPVTTTRAGCCPPATSHPRSSQSSVRVEVDGRPVSVTPRGRGAPGPRRAPGRAGS